MKPSFKNRLLYYLPLIVAGSLALFFTFFSVWYADAVGYAFFIPHNTEGISYERVSSLANIWQSQVNHWLFINGRFACHFLVQLFCQLLPRVCFDVCNAAAWILLIVTIARLSGIPRKQAGGMWGLTFLVWFACSQLPFDPAFQINYVWGATVNVSFMLTFFYRKKLSVPLLVAAALFGFIAGQWNESFSMPIALSLLIYVCRRRFSLSPVQWTAGIAYGIGTQVLCLAPGNFLRLEMINSTGESSMLQGVEQILPNLLFPAVYIILQMLNRHRNNRQETSVAPTSFLLLAAIAAYLLGAVLKFASGIRLTVFPSLVLIALIIGEIRTMRVYSAVLTSLACLLAVVLTPFQYREIAILNEKYTTLRQRYHESVDGITVLPDRLYAPQYREAAKYRTPWVQIERCVDPSKPWLRIYPESLTRINLQKDTNMCVPFMEQGWILVQSKSHPVDFIIDKVAFPGILNKKMAPRKADFSAGSDIVVDSTEAVKVAVYINERPYIQSSIAF